MHLKRQVLKIIAAGYPNVLSIQSAGRRKLQSGVINNNNNIIYREQLIFSKNETHCYPEYIAPRRKGTPTMHLTNILRRKITLLSGGITECLVVDYLLVITLTG